MLSSSLFTATTCSMNFPDIRCSRFDTETFVVYSFCWYMSLSLHPQVSLAGPFHRRRSRWSSLVERWSRRCARESRAGPGSIWCIDNFLGCPLLFPFFEFLVSHFCRSQYPREFYFPLTSRSLLTSVPLAFTCYLRLYPQYFESVL